MMSTSTKFRWGGAHARASTAARPPSLPHLRRACGVLMLFASIALFGCDSHRPSIETAPVAGNDAGADREASPFNSGSTDAAVATTLGGPIGGLAGADLARFADGQDEFEEVEGVEVGLGPVFNEASCTACHSAPIGGANGRMETRFGRSSFDGFDPLASRGGSLLQDHAIGAVTMNGKTYTYTAEVVPGLANVKAGRITTPLFGLGLVDAVPDGAFLDLARYQARYFPATAGVPNMVTEIRTGALRVGRFGWKGQVPTLHQFSGDAYLNEMGFTSPEFPLENDPQGNHGALGFNPVPAMNDDGEGVEKFFDFMTLLGPPPRGAPTQLTDAGSDVFRKIGCANCHTPTLVTGTHAVAALSRKSFQPYSDFLLHDMGTLGDGIVQGRASGRQMRTAPLWGLTARPTYLHDGRARTVEGAVLGHSGQGAGARDRYSRLDLRDRYALLAFLKSL
jgi:CxxC motif-containing protein (DUF1111 family)